ncbi:hypothetical protein DL98DRAFT_44562 [Cadophora sp. DSE1049]|nr:hypothetical protein DL98DRAFT_44562 [Cadophora sp. DSE1049]
MVIAITLACMIGWVIYEWARWAWNWDWEREVSSAPSVSSVSACIYENFLMSEGWASSQASPPRDNQNSLGDRCMAFWLAVIRERKMYHRGPTMGGDGPAARNANNQIQLFAIACFLCFDLAYSFLACSAVLAFDVC